MAEKKTLSFKKDEAARNALLSWWKSLEELKGDRAELRRCHTPLDVAFCPAYHRLLHQLQNCDVKVNKSKLAIVAGILAHVKKNDGISSMPELMASSKKGGSDGARVSGLRFRRLLAIPENDPDILYTSMLRMVRMVDMPVNILSFANDLYWWNKNTRKQYAYKYYAKAKSEV